jgi:uncharacterized protein (DUF952 family)
MSIAYKVLTSAQATALQADRFFGAPVDVADGYVHLSTAAQLTETVRKHFSGQDGLWVAAVDLAIYGDTIRWETSRGGAQFPHLYGTLTMAGILALAPLAWDADGSVSLPAPR